MVKRGWRRWGLPFLSAALVSVAVAIGFSAYASAHAYSSIVIDAQSGKVVSEYNADLPNYPASLTKMMTLYLTFRALHQHRISLDTSFPVSAHAAAQQPTKLNLVPGEKVSVQNLILGLVTQSANDAAVVLAEGLGGSESAFAKRMTETAHAMGMDHTVFYNASGLPNLRQHTTARDMATLARRLYLDFPQDYHYFDTRTFTFHGVTYTNHNHLMNRFAGMDGIKTGFIDASGFNLAASAVRHGRRLIGVVLGGVSAHARDMKMAALLNAAFAGRPSPDLMLAATRHRKSEHRPAHVTFHMIAGRAVGTLSRLSPITHAEAATPRHRAVRWSIQVGAYRAHASAVRAGVFARAHARAARGKPLVVVKTRSHHGALYDARIVDLTAREAHSACAVLHREHRDCAILGPSLRNFAQNSGGVTPLARS